MEEDDKEHKFRPEIVKKMGDQGMFACIAPEKFGGLALPEGLLTQIQRSVEKTVLDLVKTEVKRHFAQELQRIEKLSPEELVRFASWYFRIKMLI